MVKILIAGCEQEISSFNPVPSQYGDFEIHGGPDLIAANAGAETCIRGALDVFCARRNIEVIPTYGAKACSAGPLSRAGFERIAGELLAAIRERPWAWARCTFACTGPWGPSTSWTRKGTCWRRRARSWGPGARS